MRRDSIFYQLFQQFPSSLFDLLPTAPPQASDYHFESITVKETAFQLDGVFLPPESGNPRVVYFCEVQFQKDEQFYERFFSEIFIYLYRFRQTLANWQAVVIYPNRQTEQTNCTLYALLLNSPQIHRIYLDELESSETTSLPVQLIQLTVIQSTEAKELAQSIVRQAKAEPPETQQAIIDLATTIIAYKFTHLTRQEVEEMLGFTTSELKNSRFYQEITAEALEQGREEGELIGQQRGRQEGEQLLVLRLLSQRFGALPPGLEAEIKSLSLDDLEELALAIFEFQKMDDIGAWLQRH
ncbi:Rpn family recombination-promoting nuclease/putative transposase [Synechococcus sp. PCC 6312]|uniref:Rpn family recombination-promoting nuclease/putative transposase n=1 Tax=Synechococcus sp. (strain ATCC 27167 / PCC 6312) TaxID=195253 RepID=UPI00029EF3BB|nr:Rpn family recombination-promoting nuclease/putative transposase [Synechococcus sp. PCC 6312]AFY60759.1 hypothetical protein Syn6312_1599 [Synechococcus sp. PCC 6312]